MEKDDRPYSYSDSGDNGEEEPEVLKLNSSNVKSED